MVCEKDDVSLFPLLPASVYLLRSLANRNWRTLCHVQKAKGDQCLRKGKAGISLLTFPLVMSV